MLRHIRSTEGPDPVSDAHHCDYQPVPIPPPSSSTPLYVLDEYFLPGLALLSE